ncbi:MAG: coproporphyrinogen III oxidase, partial [Pseudomonadota bacterium]
DEMLLMGLRLKEGLRMPRYEALTGHPINAERLSDLIEYGMIEHLNQNRIRATAEGCLVLDAVIADLAS